MQKEQLEEILQVQHDRLVDDLKLDEEALEGIQSTLDSLISTQLKIKALNSYVDNYKKDIREYMQNNNLNVLYASKGKASYKVSDITSIKKDLVLMVIDEFNNGQRDTLEFEDVSETKSQIMFSARPIIVERED